MVVENTKEHQVNIYYSKIKEVIHDLLLAGKKDNDVLRNFIKWHLYGWDLEKLPEACRSPLQDIKDKVVMYEQAFQYDTVRSPLERGLEENLYPRTVNSFKRKLWEVFLIMQEQNK